MRRLAPVLQRAAMTTTACLEREPLTARPKTVREGPQAPRSWGRPRTMERPARSTTAPGELEVAGSPEAIPSRCWVERALPGQAPLRRPTRAVAAVQMEAPSHLPRGRRARRAANPRWAQEAQPREVVELEPEPLARREREALPAPATTMQELAGRQHPRALPSWARSPEVVVVPAMPARRAAKPAPARPRSGRPAARIR
jgi:hypothetical protein